jgi:hypothetical protein
MLAVGNWRTQSRVVSQVTVLSVIIEESTRLERQRGQVLPKRAALKSERRCRFTAADMRVGSEKHASLPEKSDPLRPSATRGADARSAQA